MKVIANLSEMCDESDDDDDTCDANAGLTGVAVAVTGSTTDCLQRWSITSKYTKVWNDRRNLTAWLECLVDISWCCYRYCGRNPYQDPR